VTPLVSIVCATYNRSAVLALALDTALRQTIADIEVIVVGDACTDDTEAVVAAITDPRVRWIGRAVNFGEQSQPNNDGVAAARGRYVAFLNQDDLWWPDHLATALEHIEREPADLVFTFAAAVRPDGGVEPIAASTSGRYERHLGVPATTWLLRRELAEQIGPWRPARQTLVAPSQDWLCRADRAGHVLAQAPHLTALVLYSAARPGSYREHAGADEHAPWHARLLADPAGLREEILTRLAIGAGAAALAPRPLRAGLLRVAKDGARRAAIRAGYTPAHLLNALRYGRAGGFIAHARRVRGLDRAARRKPALGRRWLP
jgi:hypothetical protein